MSWPTIAGCSKTSVPLLLAAVVLLTLRPAAAVALGNAPGQICAHITKASGSVEVYQFDDEELLQALKRRSVLRSTEAHVWQATRTWRPAERGQALFVGDQVRTHNTGFVTIRFADGDPTNRLRSSSVSLGNNAHVGIKEFEVYFDAMRHVGAKGALELFFGGIRALLRSFGENSSYTVEGAHTLCSTRGAEFNMTHDPEQGYVNVAVQQGDVTLASAQDARTVKAGQAAAMLRGKFADPPLP